MVPGGTFGVSDDHPKGGHPPTPTTRLGVPSLNLTTRTYALIIMKIMLVVNYYLISLSFKFHKDQSFCYGDIALFVTLYNLEVKIFRAFFILK